MLSTPLLLAFLINSVLVALAVAIHYEILRLLSKTVPKLKVKPRLRVVIGVYGTILAHIIEVWLFGIAYFLMLKTAYFGSLEGNFEGYLLDCVYFSFTSYTTLGYGDIFPSGNLRFLAGLEGVTGLCLITWSASFMFIEMTKFWKVET